MIRRIVSIVLCVLLCFTLSACFRVDNRKEEIRGDYHDGYVDGYSDGFVEGQEELGAYADYCFDEICSENDIEYALAILILSTDGEEFAEEEIENAIWAVNLFYEDVHDMVIDVENYYR